MAGKIEKHHVIFAAVAILLTFSWGYAQEIDVTPPVILELNVSPNPFSPNGDGIDDNAIILGVASKPVIWHLTFTDSEGNYQGETRLLGLTDHFAYGWIGMDIHTGEPLPEGTYYITVFVEDTAENIAEKITTVDVVMPNASVMSVDYSNVSANVTYEKGNWTDKGEGIPFSTNGTHWESNETDKGEGIPFSTNVTYEEGNLTGKEPISENVSEKYERNWTGKEEAVGEEVEAVYQGGNLTNKTSDKIMEEGLRGIISVISGLFKRIFGI